MGLGMLRRPRRAGSPWVSEFFFLSLLSCASPKLVFFEFIYKICVTELTVDRDHQPAPRCVCCDSHVNIFLHYRATALLALNCHVHLISSFLPMRASTQYRSIALRN